MADATTTTYGFTKPEVGASDATWGGKLNGNWDDVDDLLDGTTAIAPNLTFESWKVGGTAVTASAAELNKLDGVTAMTAEINKLDGLSGTILTDAGTVVESDATATLTAGYDVTSSNAGTKSSGTFTPDPTTRNLQYAVNGGAHVLAPPSTDCSMVIHYTNNASAGAITTTGFNVVTGDTITTTNADEFLFYITRVNSVAHLNVIALQ